MIQFLACVSLVCILCGCSASSSVAQDDPTVGDSPWVRYVGARGPGVGRHIVLVSGDDEYRSEEALPQLGKILAQHHGFTCTVLFPIDEATGLIKPDHQTNIPGLECLADADLMIIATRFRNLPPVQMAHIDRYVQSGKPIIGLRTATHAFRIPADSAWHRYSWDARTDGWEGGFGRTLLGETWVAHHGQHGVQSTRGIAAPGASAHSILRGVEADSIWGPTDVYRVRLPMRDGFHPVVLGAVLEGMKSDDAVAAGAANEPMMPIAWTHERAHEGTGNGRVFTTTMGAATDLVAAGTRRMLVNATYWAMGMEAELSPEGAAVDLVGSYEPTDFGFSAYVVGRRPSDHRLVAE